MGCADAVSGAPVNASVAWTVVCPSRVTSWRTSFTAGVINAFLSRDIQDNVIMAAGFTVS